MVEIPRGQIEGEQKYNNVSVRFLVGRHVLDTESRYADYRKSVENVGSTFFRRGFTNILFLENAVNETEDKNVQFNEFARVNKSFRKAYWRVYGGLDEGVTDDLVAGMDRQPGGALSRLKNAGMDPFKAWGFAMQYATYTALDGLYRKGLEVSLEYERFTENRAEMARISQGRGHIPTYLRTIAPMSQQADIDFAKQIEDILDRNPFKTRVLCVMGSAHSRSVNYLPVELGEIEISRFSDEVIKPTVGVLHDLQDGVEMADEEIMEKLK